MANDSEACRLVQQAFNSILEALTPAVQALTTKIETLNRNRLIALKPILRSK